jgi:RNA polymerase sigma factor (sigma-70 family)
MSADSLGSWSVMTASERQLPYAMAIHNLLDDSWATAAGDREAWSRLVAALSPRIHAVAFRILGDAVAADDVTQDAALAMGRGIGRLRATDDAGVGRWAVGLGCRIALQHARSRRRREQRISTGLGAIGSVATADSRGDHADPDDLALLMCTLDELPDRQRLPIVLHFFAGLDGPALGAEIGVSPNAARVRLHRALRRLQEILGEHGLVASSSGLLIQQARIPVPEMVAGSRHLNLPLTSSAAPSALQRIFLLLLITTAVATVITLVVWLGLMDRAAGGLVPILAPGPSIEADKHSAGHDPEVPQLSDQRLILAEEALPCVPAPIIIGDDLLLTGVNNISCWDRVSLTRRWRTAIWAHLGNPAIYRDEVILTRHEQVLALGLSDGLIRWTLKVGAVGMLNNADLVIDGSRGYVATNGGTLWCLDLAHQGNPLWHIAVPGPLGTPLIGSMHELLLPCVFNRLLAVDASSGSIRWSLPMPDLTGVQSCRDGVVYVLAGVLTQVRVEAIQESDGARRWQRRLPTPSAIASGAIRAKQLTPFEPAQSRMEGSPGDAAGAGPPALVFCTTSGLYSLRTDGVLRWSVETHAFAERHPTEDRLGRIWLGCDHGELLVVSADQGHLLLRMELDQQPALFHRLIGNDLVDYGSVGQLSQPLLSQGRVYVLTALGGALSWACSSAAVHGNPALSINDLRSSPAPCLRP